MRLPLAVSVVLLLAVHPGDAGAQSPLAVQWPRATPPEVRLPSSTRLSHWATLPPLAIWQSAADSVRIAATHWKAGAVVGGTVLGLLGAAAFVGLCGYDSPCQHPVGSAMGGFALGAVVGFGLGALVGGQFPANSP